MCTRTLTCLPVLRTFLNAKNLQNARLRMMSEKQSEQCKQPCVDDPPKRHEKIKKLQNEFQSKEGCPVWLISSSDKFLYYSTVGLTVAGLGLSLYNLLAMAILK